MEVSRWCWFVRHWLIRLTGQIAQVAGKVNVKQKSNSEERKYIPRFVFLNFTHSVDPLRLRDIASVPAWPLPSEPQRLLCGWLQLHHQCVYLLVHILGNVCPAPASPSPWPHDKLNCRHSSSASAPTIIQSSLDHICSVRSRQPYCCCTAVVPREGEVKPRAVHGPQTREATVSDLDRVRDADVAYSS